MIRRLVVLALAVPLALISACSAFIPADPDNEKLVGALTTLVDTLGRGEYAAAAALMCPGTEAEPFLRTEFEPHPRPWKQSVTMTSRSDDDSGLANIDLTPSGKPVVKYTFTLVRLADGSWQVCDVDTGSVHVDVDVG